MKSASKKAAETVETNETVSGTTATQEENYVAKLSIKALGCDPRLGAGVNRKILCRIYGAAQGLKHGEDKNTGNLWTALQGKFEGQNCEQGAEDFGKVLRSGKLFLPAGIQDMVEGAVREIENSKEGAAEPNVAFALEVCSVKAANRIGYSYEAKNLMPVAQQDPLAAMRQAIEAKSGAVKLIAGPKGEK